MEICRSCSGSGIVWEKNSLKLNWDITGLLEKDKETIIVRR
jgi:hypothetical protein